MIFYLIIGVKYTDNGYVELDVNTITKNDMVRLIINIEDSGIGIDSEKLGSLFVNKKDYKEDNYDLNDTLYNVEEDYYYDGWYYYS